MSVSEPEPSFVERVIVARIGREMRARGSDWRPTAAAVSSVREVLEREELGESEARALAECEYDPDVDRVAALVAARVEDALAAGLAAAEDGDPDRAGPPPASVFVLRSERRTSEETYSTQLTSALFRVRARLDSASGAEGEERPATGGTAILVLAEGEAFEDLRLRIAPRPGEEAGEGAGEGAGVAFLGRDEAEDARPARPIEVVQVDGGLEPVERGVARFATSAETGAADESGSSLDAADDPLVGRLFHDKYRILRRIGVGGFGAVYEARDERGAGNRVAIKILGGEAARSADLKDTFKDEARRVTRLAHPNIVDWKVFDETADGVGYFVMELLRGQELHHILKAKGRLEPQRAARLMHQILSALRAAHHLPDGSSILHLDLKPANVFVCPSRTGGEELVKVIDFGIGQYAGGEPLRATPAGAAADAALGAELPGTEEPVDAFGPSTITAPSSRGAVAHDSQGRPFTRSTACTPEYASPEQCAHILGDDDLVPLDGRSDLFSFGVMACQMLTGQLPFENPGSRYDLLRLHREQPARKVATLGARLPGRLAAFVDRCLERDRDARFPDTNAAWEALDAIIDPPVWKTVVKVVAPLAALLLAVVVWVAARDPAAAASELGLTAAGGALDLRSERLHMGPERAAVLLELERGGTPAAAGSGGAALADAPLTLVDADDGTPLDDWRATWEEGGIVRLEAIARDPGLVERRVRLRAEGAAESLAPFTLVWLGASAWSVDATEIGGRDARSLGALPIDPNGLELALWIAGDGRDELETVSVDLSASGGTVWDLSPSLARDGRVLYALDLGVLRLADGPAQVDLRVVDRAGGRWSSSLSLAVEGAPLALEGLRLLDRSGDADAATWPECNRLAGRYSIVPRTRPQLEVRLSAVADLEWSVWLDGADEPADSGVSSGRTTHHVAIEGLAGLAGGAAYDGRLRIVARDGAHRLRADAGGRGTAIDELPFTFLDAVADFSAAVVVDGVRQPLQAPGLNAFRAGALEVAVVRDAPVPMRLVAAWGSEGPGGEPLDPRTLESEELRDPRRQEARLALPPMPDGVYRLVLRAYQYDSAADVTADRADLERSYRVLLDTRAPQVRLSGLEPQRVFRAGDGERVELEVTLEDEPGAGDLASPVDVSWEWRRPGAALPEIVVAAGEVPAEDLETGRASLALALPWAADGAGDVDGPWTLALQAGDGAGNRGEPVEVPVVVSVAGPTLALESPAPGGRWQPTAPGGQWAVQVRARDANGVASVRASLERGDGEAPLELELTPEPTPGDAADPTRRVFTGAIGFPHDWSGSELWVGLRGVDGLGTPSASRRLGPFRLPAIELPRPVRLAATREGHALESMRLVTGNAGHVYVFGGRDDASENEAFAEAGLPPFNPDPRRYRSLSWQIEFKPGEIDDFYLDENEVSCAQFLAFLEDERGWSDAGHRPAGSAPPTGERRAELAARLSAEPPDRPATGVTWEEASAYAHWAGKRLPTWVELEYAARGGAHYRPYASFDGASSPGPVAANAAGDVTAVEAAWSRGEGADVTPDTGLRDLAGNAAEWTATPVTFADDGPADETLRRHAERFRPALLEPARVEGWDARPAYWYAGGSFAGTRFDFSVANRGGRRWESPDVGFRCALSLEEFRSNLARGSSPARTWFRESTP